MFGFVAKKSHHIENAVDNIQKKPSKDIKNFPKINWFEEGLIATEENVHYFILNSVYGN